MSARVTVIGSCNTDMVVRLPHLPVPGETVLGGTFAMVQGGKGANQAVAAARAGGAVAFIGRVGNDSFGAQARIALENERINVEFLATDAGCPSGVALIVVDARGENAIAVAPGANGNVTPEDVHRAHAVIASSDILVAQLEVPVESIRAAALIAASAGVPVVLNPAPALPLDDRLLQNVAIITPNEHEAALLTGTAVRDDAGIVCAAEALRRRGVATVIVTLGARGVYFTNGTHNEWIPSFHVNAVDTTAAGMSSRVRSPSLSRNTNHRLRPAGLPARQPRFLLRVPVPSRLPPTGRKSMDCSTHKRIFLMPRIIEIGVTVDELAARRNRIEQTKRFELPDRVPVIPAIAHRFLVPMTGTRFREYYADPETMLRTQLIAQKWLMENIRTDAFSITGPWVGAWTDFQNTFEAGSLGCPVVFPDDDIPWVGPGWVNTDGDLKTLEAMDFLHTGINARQIAFRRGMIAVGEKYPVRFQGGEVFYPGATPALTHTSDGPFGVAGDLMGQTELFLATKERPDFVHELLRIVTDKLIAYLDFCWEEERLPAPARSCVDRRSCRVAFRRHIPFSCAALRTPTPVSL